MVYVEQGTTSLMAQHQSVIRTGTNHAATTGITVAVATRHHTAHVTIALTTGPSTESGRKVGEHKSGGVMESAVSFSFLTVLLQNVTLTRRTPAADITVATPRYTLPDLVRVLAVLTTKL